MVAAYIPDAGDVVWLNFTPQTGREQSGHRPALVLTPKAYNSKTSLMLCCPMTTKIKGYPFEVRVQGDTPSVILADQVKSLDWRQRHASFAYRLQDDLFLEAKAKIKALLGF
jgi:mRNA interferase MazF